RILLEAINNTLKYAQASHIEIDLLGNKDSISLKYKDNGIGFDYNQVMKEGKGMGLFNIHNRIQALKGQYTITTQPGEGFEMQIFLPINE
ncbi:MAG TPA: ATP-binding protein, partial [Bacteroidales bacterium]|nr:ATP-binding protein [Bacteroidales bacterium]